MKSTISLILLIFIFTSTSKNTFAATSNVYRGSSYDDVQYWLAKDLYEVLPLYTIVSAETLKSVALLAMKSTLDDRNDFRTRRKKLVHPNGVCLFGKWAIESDSEYSGYFAKGSEGLVIARASVTQDLVEYEDHRAFGLAIKLFPTLDPHETVYTSNLFSVDGIEGTKNRRFMEVTMTNQIPDFNFLNLSALFRLFDRLTFLFNFNNLSKLADSGPQDRNPLIRRTIEVARAGITSEYSAVSLGDQLPSFHEAASSGEIREPKWVGFRPEALGRISKLSDFRNEIVDAIKSNGELKYKILVADHLDVQGNRVWSTIGTMSFDKAITSKPCDLDLHFHHPRTDN